VCNSKLPARSATIFAGIAFVSTLIGTILHGINWQIPATIPTGYSMPGIGCAIAGTIVQAIVFGLTFLPGANEPTLKLATPAQPAV